MSFLKNAWYVGGFEADIGREPVSRQICNQLLVMFRTEAGDVAVLDDRCPHRFVPLSLGTLEGDSIRCIYHGLRFGTDGTCVERPHDDGPMPPQLCVHAYPAVARHGVIWIWMGAVERADPETIPDFSFIADTERFRTVRGYLKVQANYELLADNLLDLSHVHYLHPQIRPEDGFERYENVVEQEGDTIWSRLRKPGYVPSPFQRSLWGSDSPRADGRSDVRWDAPASLLAPSAVAEEGQPIDEGVQLPNAHLITPETEFTSHYFWAVGRTARKDDPELDTLLTKVIGDTFSTQDAVVVEAQQRAMGQSTDFLAQRPVILKADAAGVRARRTLRRLIRQEQGTDGAAVEPEQIAAE